MHEGTVKQIQRVFKMPWIGANELRSLIGSHYRRTKLCLSGVQVGENCKFYGKPIVQRHRDSHIQLGDDVDLRSSPQSNPLTPNHPVVLATRAGEATIRIQDGTGLTGTTIVAEESITIGEDVAMGANATVVDTDFHPIDPSIRKRDFLNGEAKPIDIGDNVFVGMNSIILKGVTIGDGCVVGAGSVVSSDVPEKTLVAGNPAEVVRKL